MQEKHASDEIESAEGGDALSFLTTWRMAIPEEFNRLADSLVAEVKAMPRGPEWEDDYEENVSTP